jgi:enamine deaminase RidA (YjgF/YER057c/UK114 family)
MNVKLNLEQLGLKLLPAPKPIGNYVAAVHAGDLLFISGQLPIKNGELQYAGQVGSELTEKEGYAAAQLAALNVLAQIESALGSFDRLAHLVRVECSMALQTCS